MTKHTTMARRWYAKHPVIATAALAGTLAIGGTAFAYWTTSGSGTGTGATAAGSSGLVVTQNGAGTTMTPGGPDQQVNYTITNPTTSPKYATTVTLTLSAAGDAVTWNTDAGALGAANTVNDPSRTMLDHNAGDTAVGCTTADFSVAGTDTDTVGIDIAASGGTVVATWGGSGVPATSVLAVRMLNTVANQDACKDTTVKTVFTVA